MAKGDIERIEITNTPVVDRWDDIQFKIIQITIAKYHNGGNRTHTSNLIQIK